MRYAHLLFVGLSATLALFASNALAQGKHAKDSNSVCSKTAVVLRKACFTDIGVNLGEASANCLNITDAADRQDCYAEAAQAKQESAGDCGDVYDERRALCESLGEAPYEPEFGEEFAANFVNPLDIGGSVAPNPYYPLIPGTTRSFKDNSPDPETGTVTVTQDTKLIEGVTCIVVRDVVSKGGVVTEDTDDWFAQDLQGNVWYCGESSRQQETFPGDNPQTPEIVGIEGSWKAGDEAGSKPGIVMAANPQVGETRRLELSWGEAEDANEILSVNASEATPGASCTNTCVQTRDFSPIEPGAEEQKFYAPGVGVILEVDLETGVRNELQP